MFLESLYIHSPGLGSGFTRWLRLDSIPQGAHCLTGKTNKRQMVETMWDSLWWTGRQHAARVGVGEGSRRRKLWAWTWRLSRRPQQTKWEVHMWKVSKPRLCTLIKAKQKDEFIARVFTCKPGNSRLWEQWVPSCSQTKGFLCSKCRCFWLFQLIGCLVVFFLIWIMVAELGEKEVQRWLEETWCLGIGWRPLLVSEKSYKFLQLMLGGVKFHFSLMCLHWPTPCCLWHKWLNFNLVLQRATTWAQAKRDHRQYICFN